MSDTRFRVPAALTGVAVAMAMLVGTAALPSAATSFVPASRDVVLRGHGYGHGIGMSQYGAEGAARLGRTWQDIVRFYYPGTTIGSAGGLVRVLITGDTTSDVKVSPAQGLSIRDLGDGRTWRLPVGGTTSRWRINADRTVQRFVGGSWRRWTTPSGRSRMLGDAEFFRPAGGPVRLWVPTGGVEVAKGYRGTLRSSHADTVNVLPLEAYLRGVVPLEMPASWSTQALAAQAVAARTYALSLRSQTSSRYYQICDTTSCQVYGGADGEHPRSDVAIKAAAGRVLRHAGAPALTMFSSSNGGRTAAGGRPYLVTKRDPWDGWSGNPVHSWRATLTASTIESAYPSIGRLIGIDVTRRVGGGEWGGRVEQLVLDGTRGDATVQGTDFRFRFGLRSHWFEPASTPIGDRWRAIGGATSRVGATKGVEFANNGGAVQVFRSGRIFWTERTGAREARGPILRRYLQLGGTGSRLGFPTTGEIRAAVPGSRLNKFQRGRIYWHSGTGAHEVYGAILARYVQLGAARSRLGLPVRGEYAVRGGRASDFQGGRLVWHRASKTVTVHYS